MWMCQTVILVFMEIVKLCHVSYIYTHIIKFRFIFIETQPNTNNITHTDPTPSHVLSGNHLEPSWNWSGVAEPQGITVLPPAYMQPIKNDTQTSTADDKASPKLCRSVSWIKMILVASSLQSNISIQRFDVAILFWDISRCLVHISHRTPRTVLDPGLK